MSAEPGFISVVNWEHYQHYKDRTPPWIKLHRDLLNDYKFSRLQTASKAHLMLIWLLASQMDNKIPNDPDWIAARIGESSPIDLNILINQGFLISDSVALADCKHLDIVETETETETEAEAEAEKPPSKKSNRKTSLNPDLQLPDDYRDYCTQKRPDLDPESTWENFSDYYVGRGVTMADWKRTWQRWVREEKRGRNVPTNNRKSPQDRQREAAKLYLAGNNG